MNTLHELLKSNFKIIITKKHTYDITKFIKSFETRPGTSEVLGSALLGITKIFFTAKDEQELFGIFNIDYAEFRKVVNSASSVNPAFKVASNPYNILSIYLVHKIINSSLSSKEKYDTSSNILKLMHYRFFTSVVNYNFSYGADEGTMQYTVDHLNNKFVIKKTGSWKKLIEERVTDNLAKNGIHFKTFKNFNDDKDIFYAITDIQTRIRKQLIAVVQLYYENKQAGRTIYSNNILEDIQGETSLRIIETGIGDIAINIVNKVTNLAEFLDYQYIKYAVMLNKEITEDLFISLLNNFSSVAEVQEKKKDTELIKGSKDKTILIGYKTLVFNILQKSYRHCLLDPDVNPKSKADILQKIRSIFRSSRFSDKDILIIKNSVDYFVNKYSKSKRENTNVGLRSAFILYIIMLSFTEMK